MGVPENIDALLVKYDITQDHLARIANVTPGAVTGWRKGSTPREDALKNICEKFGLERDDILSDSYGLAAKEHGRVGSPLSPVPLYGTVAAGTPIEMLPVDDMKEAPARFLDDDPDCYLVRVRGGSMNHHIQDGDFALISPKHVEPNERDMFLVTVNGDDATIKHVRKLANGVELVPDSYDPTYRPRIVDFGDDGAPPVRILGKVVWWCREF